MPSERGYPGGPSLHAGEPSSRSGGSGAHRHRRDPFNQLTSVCDALTPEWQAWTNAGPSSAVDANRCGSLAMPRTTSSSSSGAQSTIGIGDRPRPDIITEAADDQPCRSHGLDSGQPYEPVRSWSITTSTERTSSGIRLCGVLSGDTYSTSPSESNRDNTGSMKDVPLIGGSRRLGTCRTRNRLAVRAALFGPHAERSAVNGSHVASGRSCRRSGVLTKSGKPDARARLRFPRCFRLQ